MGQGRGSVHDREFVDVVSDIPVPATDRHCSDSDGMKTNVGPPGQLVSYTVDDTAVDSDDLITDGQRSTDHSYDDVSLTQLLATGHSTGVGVVGAAQPYMTMEMAADLQREISRNVIKQAASFIEKKFTDLSSTITTILEDRLPRRASTSAAVVASTSAPTSVTTTMTTSSSMTSISAMTMASTVTTMTTGSITYAVPLEQLRGSKSTSRKKSKKSRNKDNDMEHINVSSASQPLPSTSAQPIASVASVTSEVGSGMTARRSLLVDQNFDSDSEILVPDSTDSISDYIENNVFDIQETMALYSVKEADIPYVKEVLGKKKKKRPMVVRVADCVLDLTALQCPLDEPDYWKKVLLRFPEWVCNVCDDESHPYPSSVDEPQSKRQKTDDSISLHAEPDFDHQLRDEEANVDGDNKSDDDDGRDEGAANVSDDSVQPTVKLDSSQVARMKESLRIMQKWDGKLKDKLVPRVASEKFPPESDEPVSASCLPPHPRHSNWYNHADGWLKAEKMSSRKIPLSIPALKTQAAIFPMGKDKVESYKPRTFPARFDKICPPGKDQKGKPKPMDVGAFQGKDMQVPMAMWKSYETHVRTGISTASNELHVLAAARDRISQIIDVDLLELKNGNRVTVLEEKSDGDKKYRVPLAKQGHREMRDGINDVLAKNRAELRLLQDKLAEVRQVVSTAFLAADFGLAAWVSLDHNLVLQHRDRALDRLTSHFKHAIPDLRRTQVDSPQIFHGIDELIESADTVNSAADVSALVLGMAAKKSGSGPSNRGNRGNSFNRGNQNSGRKWSNYRQNNNNYRGRGQGRGRGRGRGRDFRRGGAGGKGRTNADQPAAEKK